MSYIGFFSEFSLNNFFLVNLCHTTQNLGVICHTRHFNYFFVAKPEAKIVNESYLSSCCATAIAAAPRAAAAAPCCCYPHSSCCHRHIVTRTYSLCPSPACSPARHRPAPSPGRLSKLPPYLERPLPPPHPQHLAYPPDRFCMRLPVPCSPLVVVVPPWPTVIPSLACLRWPSSHPPSHPPSHPMCAAGGGVGTGNSEHQAPPAPCPHLPPPCPHDLPHAPTSPPMPPPPPAS